MKLVIDGGSWRKGTQNLPPFVSAAVPVTYDDMTLDVTHRRCFMGIRTG
jgi:hypothetical protein